LIINSLKNYDKVVNYVYNEYITEKIIDFYRDYVLNRNNYKSKIILLDKVVYEYLYNYKFMDYVKDKIKKEEENIETIFFSNIYINIIKMYKDFKKEKVLESTRWL